MNGSKSCELSPLIIMTLRASELSGVLTVMNFDFLSLYYAFPKNGGHKVGFSLSNGLAWTELVLCHVGGSLIVL